jgi:addiction module HigA family antidote
MSTLEPIHPGEILAADFMEPYGLSSNALARAVGVKPSRINDIVRGRRGISADTALRLARYFDMEPQTWLNLQDRYDLEMARRASGDAIDRIQPRGAA